ncbi:16S rRNA (uracil(1498)-N(3))-methyltransferase [Pseudomonas sp. 21LCFQ02]|uniref:16S rRNA (uracil(1498)-N(3))-methyltransferase n=1 Tax=unclassified Pseudomonas TaxID=196821 RepID=UPI0004F587A1|nr:MULTISPECIES: 16S rRNA (uracil(1498)-N(3))-methyltransferase [unclassified Pseudomonas]MCO8167194.1 16S rRNA (uracil(1498)-N(3))-methyltransferase [Pseudomonas sp. 21LCFQ02]MCQ9426858.1 16S rRNA (uracil(1498)-N(3))-methyltransferase [Pseudomonas sp. LJDD11]BAP42024.1 16S ribosomal RNA methyltransferase RsmE [Pseudomonas sp. StFLB209]
MRLSRFFIDAPLSLGEHTLPEAQAHYIGRVLRMTEGQALQLFDGSGSEYRATLLEVGKKQVRVQLDESFAGQPESPLRIHLGQGLSRGERMDWAIQKATELGATEITPIVSERCEVRLKDERAEKRQAHWRQIAISACEQCGRSVVPVIHSPIPLGEWLKTTQADLKLVLHPVAAPLTSHPAPQSLAFLIGPEGGLSDAEVEQAKASGYHAARLGPRVLRTETAPVVALSVAQQLWGDFLQGN